MITNILNRKCKIFEKTTTRGPLGETVEWDEIGDFWTRHASVDISTRTAYMQENTVVTDKFIFEGKLNLRLGQHQIEYDGDVYELAESAQFIEGMTTVLTQRV